MSGNERIAFLRQRLTEAFQPLRLDIVDEPVQGGGHFQVTVISEAFAGKSLIERHRMVYAAVGDALKSEIHALSISAKTPQEADH